MFLLTLINAEAGWLKFSTNVVKPLTESSQPSDWNGPLPDDFPADAEEDNTESREMYEYESHFVSYADSAIDPLINLHYTHQHLVYKEHHAELIVPPPKG